jgi:hypothetical protein
MQRNDVAYVVNSTPKYYYLLEGHFQLMNLYGNDLQWPRYLGTEVESHEMVQTCKHLYGVNVVPLSKADAGFWESRVATIEALPSDIKYVLPMQEDFLLERPGIDSKALEELLKFMDSTPDIFSARLMPCPGPKVIEPVFGKWTTLTENDEYLFTFQATLWRRDAYIVYLKLIIQEAKRLYPSLRQDSKEWSQMAVNMNIAESAIGRRIFLELFPKGLHLAWIRTSPRPNAVYECPWPYRPTAVVKGVLQGWAKELLKREGITICVEVP